MFSQMHREHFVQTFQALQFCNNLKPVDPKVLSAKQVSLFRKEIDKCNPVSSLTPNLSSDKKTLVFDLDETLIHCNESSEMPSDVILPIKFPTGEIIDVRVLSSPKSAFFFIQAGRDMHKALGTRMPSGTESILRNRGLHSLALLLRGGRG